MGKIIHNGRSVLVLAKTEEGKNELLKTPSSYGGDKHFSNEWEILQDLDIAGVRRALRREYGENGVSLVLEYIEGMTLKQWLESCELTMRARLECALKTAQVISAVHGTGIVHTAINPFNILVEEDSNSIFLIDFARALRPTQEVQHSQSHDNIEYGLAYIAPEQTGRINRPIGFVSDLYSFGVVLYELFTGQLPFEAQDTLGLIHAHIAKTPIDPDKINPQLPVVIAKIINTLLNKKPEKRYQTAHGVKADLERCLEEFNEKGNIAEFQICSKDISNQFGIPEKLYGRDSEISVLINTFNCVSNGDNKLLLVGGYSGIGKTSIVNSLHNTVKARNGYFINGKFDLVHRNIPYSALVQAFNGLFQTILTESEENLKLWNLRLKKALGINGQLIIDMMPDVELIIGAQPAVVWLGPVETQNRFNLVFRNLIRAFCDKDHPLVVFLDDLQWIDAASLKLLHLMISDKETSFLLVIGAYRDNEVDGTHPLMRMLNQLQQNSVDVTEIMLKPLQDVHVQQLVAETCRVGNVTAIPLAKLVMQKTEGNPFFVNQFLNALYADQLFHLDAQRHIWTWNMQLIEERNITDNVVELMVNRLRRLPEASLQVIKLASCVGAGFDEATLCTICSVEREEIAEKLLPVLQVALILLVNKPPFGRSGKTYRFLHDRVQQVAYTMIDKDEKKEIHLQIGRLLFKDIDNVPHEDRIFEIVNHFNVASDLLKEGREKIEIAGLNQIAGVKAISAMASDSAVEYFETGISLLPENAWEEHYFLTLNLTCGLIESFYLTASYQQAYELCKSSLLHAQSVIDKVKIYTLMCYNFTLQNRMKETLTTGLEALKILNIPLVKNPPENIDVDKMRNLPEMKEPDKLAAMSIMVNMTASSLVTQSELMMPIIYTMVDLAARHGNSSKAPFGYIWYGCSLCWNGNIELGYRFGRLAIDVMVKFTARDVETTVLQQFNSFIRHWCEHEQLCLDTFPHIVQIGKERGDLEYGTYVAVNYVTNLLLSGEPLDSVQEKQRPYLDWVASTKFSFSLTYGNIWAQATLCLMGQTENAGVLQGDFLDEKRLIPELESNKNNLNLYAVYAAKAMLAYFNCSYSECVDFALEAEQYEAAIGGLLPSTQVPFYGALALLQITQSCPGNELDCNVKLEAYETKLQIWSELGYMNFQHKYDLVRAEKARVQGDSWAAVKYYEQAIKGARKNQYLHEEALACELAAMFYRENELEELAKNAIKKSYELYQLWGGQPKVKQLRRDFSVWLSDELVKQDCDMAEKNSLDMHSIIKSARALSEHIVLNDLLTRMIGIVIENAGAQRGVFVMKNNEQWYVEAEENTESNSANVMMSIPLGKSNKLPKGVINYVIRTGKTLLLANACAEEQFSHESYVQEHNVKSVFCLPLIYKGALNAILYLENNLAENTFTRDQFETLEILSSQISVSLENAYLYAEMEQKVVDRTCELKTAKEEADRERVLAESANRAKTDFLASMSHELRTPLHAILGFSELLKRDSSLTSKQRKNIEIINVSGEHLLTMINDVLDIARIEAGRNELKLKNFDLHRLLENISEMILIQARYKDIIYKLEYAPNLPRYINADIGKLRQALINILGNAIKFTNKGAVTLRVNRLAKECELQSMRLIFAIEDTGIGIQPDRMHEVFDPFVQLSKVKESKTGVGLGLAISRNFARLMGGDISVKSKLGVGSIFNLEISAKAVDLEDVIMAEPDRGKVVCLVSGHIEYRILVVDDDPLNRSLMTDILVDVGFTVHDVDNGKDALKEFKQWKPHLICLDMRMPVMDGYETARQIAAKPEADKPIVVAMTANVFEKNKEKALEAGCDAFVRKPFNKKNILEIIGKLLDVNYVYEKDSLEEPKSDMEEVFEKTLNPASLDSLTTGLRDKFSQAIKEHDVDAVASVITQIEVFDAAMAKAMKSYADNFQYEQLAKLLKLNI